MIIKVFDAFFEDFAGTGAVRISSSALEAEFKSSLFTKCSCSSGSGGAIGTDCTSVKLNISFCCGRECQTDFKEGSDKDLGQFLFIKAQDGFANVAQVSTYLCAKSVDGFNRHGSICSYGDASYNFQRLNFSSNFGMIGPGLFGYYSNNFFVSHALATDCHSLYNGDLQSLSAVAISKSRYAPLQYINFINCSCKLRMDSAQLGLYSNCVIYNCTNYILSCFGSPSNVESFTTDTFGILSLCKIIITSTYCINLKKLTAILVFWLSIIK